MAKKKTKAVELSPMYFRWPIDWRKRAEKMAKAAGLTMAQFIHAMLKPVLEGTAVAVFDDDGDVIRFDKRKRRSATMSPAQCSQRGGAQPNVERAQKMFDYHKRTGREFKKTAANFGCSVASVRQLFYRHNLK